MRRFVGGQWRKYPTFTPLAIAAIGTLPLPLLHQGVVINMQRSTIRSNGLIALLFFGCVARSRPGQGTRPDEDPDVPPTTGVSCRALPTASDTVKPRMPQHSP
jgi:hypothetical protein